MHSCSFCDKVAMHSAVLPVGRPLPQTDKRFGQQADTFRMNVVTFCGGCWADLGRYLASKSQVADDA